MSLLRFLYRATPPTLRKPLYSSVMRLLTPIILRKMKGEMEKIDDLYKAVSFAFSFRYLTFSISPFQVEYEITKLLEILNELRPRYILEIGTAQGGTLFLFSRVADPKALIISVDLPGGAFGGGYPEWKMPLFIGFARDDQRIELLRADSHAPSTLGKVKDILGDDPLDFLFIDGDHTYDGVKKDFEMYSPLVREGGIIAFHDIVPGPPENVGGVPRFWAEVKRSYRHLEIVKSWNQGGYGIGVIYV